MLAGLFLLLILANGRALAGTQAILYVAPTGSGTNWSQAQPGSLVTVPAQIRTMNTNMTGDIIVYLYGGSYRLDSSFQLRENTTNHDSGNGGYNIIYQAYPGQIPIISGGLEVSGWSIYDANKNIYRAFIGTNVNSRQLYVNGLRATRARGSLSPSGFAKTATGFTTTNTAMESWGNQTNIEIVTRNAWKHLRCPISSIVGSNITMQTPCWTYASASPTPGPPWNGGGTVSMDYVSWVENAYELLASPGQWYLDQTAGYLYYIPRTNETLATASVVLPVVEKLIDADGGSSVTPLHNLVFSGITFEYGTWMGPSTSQGYADNQAGILWIGPTNAAKTLGNVSFQTVNNIQLLNNTFMHLGGAAIDFGTGAQSNNISGNVIEDVSGAGIALGEVADFMTTNPAQMTDGNSIKDNYIRQIGADFEDAVGIWVGYARNTTITHNDIDNVPYSGMSVGWGWGTYSYAQSNLIGSNYLGKVMQTLSDGGSFYTLSAQTNSVFKGNYMRDSCAEGIYWDEGTAFYTGISNVADNVLYDWVLIWTGSIHNDLATNNFSDTTAIYNNGTATVVTNTTVVTGQNWPLAALAIIQNAGLEPAYQANKIPKATVNDADINDSAYQGAWNYQNNRGYGDYDDDVHSTTNNGDYFQYVFYGTGISFVSEYNSDGGNASISLDGVYQTTINCSNATRLPQQTVFAVSNLPPQAHTLQVSKQDGRVMLVDAVIVQGVPEVLINDSDLNFDHVPSDWVYYTSRGLGDYHNDVHATFIDGQYAQYTFGGTGISFISEMNPDMGGVDVWLDGSFQGTVNCSSSTRIVQQRIYTASNLTPGTHVLKLIKNGGSYMLLDALAVVPLNYYYSLSATPLAQTIDAGQAATYSVGLTDFDGYTNAVALTVSGLPACATASFSPAAPSGSGFSTLTVTTSNNTPLGTSTLGIMGIAGTITSSTSVSLTIVSGAPMISSDTQPPSAIRYAGSPVTFSVSATGVAPFNYQWYFNNNVLIPGATNASYTLSEVQLSNAGNYNCVITNIQGAATSSVSPLTVLTAPTGSYPTAVLADKPMAWWRLDETNGTTAHDYVGGNEGTYNCVQLGLIGFNRLLNPDLAAGFGSLTNQNSYVSVNNPNAIDFSSYSNAQFSVEAWFKGSPQSAVGAALIAKGIGNGGEQFALDCYLGTNFRFFVLDNALNYHAAMSSLGPDGNWHHLVGECNSATGTLSLYVDGVLSASGSFPIGGLLRGNTVPVSIGSKQQTPPNYDAQIVASLDEVAVYNYALSSTQVQAHHSSGTNSMVTLSIQPSNGQLILNWPNGGVLQSASQAAGPYSDITNAVPPIMVAPTGQQGFYRIRIGP